MKRSLTHTICYPNNAGGVTMSLRSKREYVEAIFLRYKNASRKEKTPILDQFCTVCGVPKHPKAILPLWLPGYGQHFGTLCPDATDALLRISPATIDRVLKPVRVSSQRRGRATTKPGSLLRKHIPINTNHWDESRPGFL